MIKGFGFKINMEKYSLLLELQDSALAERTNEYRILFSNLGEKSLVGASVYFHAV